MAEQLRLDKLLADTGLWSRKEARDLIRRGQVTVDGAVVKQPEAKVDPAQSSLTAAGQPVVWQKYTYIMMNKPGGVLTATEDRRQPTVLDLLPQELRRKQLRPVGRLDKDTEGLLLLTDDGALAHRLLAPKSHVDKVYYAETEGTVDEDDVAAFAAGMTLGDGLVCQSAGLERLGPDRCLVTLREGKFHQVKRMLAARGKPVQYLKRLSMGALTLDEALEPGAWRPLTEEETRKVKGKTGGDLAK
ncbi:MAG: 16S rRNA pseudouridine(516) synthase [Clostridiales bacterium]|nr:16S rRNA pseudouridine(516) synthase [Clostridiales bacterium]